MNRLFYIFIVLTLVLIDVLFYVKVSDIRIFSIVIIYLIFYIFFLRKSFFSFILACIFIILSYLYFLGTDTLLFINPGAESVVAERFAVWAFLFFTLGIIQKFGEQ